MTSFAVMTHVKFDIVILFCYNITLSNVNVSELMTYGYKHDRIRQSKKEF